MLVFSSLPLNHNSINPSSPRQEIDESLFVRIANEDMSALEELYQCTDTSVYAFALSLLKNPQDAQDVMQDTYLKIRSGAHLYKPYGKPLAWIFTIVRNLCFMKLRKGKRDAKESLTEMGKEESTSFSDPEDKLLLDIILNELPELDRQIVILFSVWGMKHREIAELLGLGLSTELSHYHRGLKKLKKRILEGGFPL